MRYLFLTSIVFLVSAGALSSQERLEWEASPVTVEPGKSLVMIRGIIGGERLSFSWDFSRIGPTSNGAMTTQTSSNRAGAVSVAFESDYHPTHHPQRPNDWSLRFTLGSLRPGDSWLSAKKTFSIPQNEPYLMLTLRKSPQGRQYRHSEHDRGNVTEVQLVENTYNEESRTLRLEGSLRSEWTGGDWLQADFDVTVGGADDRNASSNSGTFARAF